METSTGEGIRIGGLEIRFLLEGKSSGGAIAMFEFDVAAGAKMPIAHSHDAYEETIYGLEGVLTFTVDGREIEVGPGEVLCIARGAVHRFDNFGAGDTKMLADCYSGHPRPRLLPRNRGGGGSIRRRSAQSCGDRRSDAAARPDSGAVTQRSPQNIGVPFTWALPPGVPGLAGTAGG